MHDLDFIRQHSAEFDKGLSRRGLEPLSAALLSLDKKRKSVQTELQQSLANRNDLSRQIGEIKKNKGNADVLMAQVAALKARIPELEAEEQAILGQINAQLETLPNLPAAEVPDGGDETCNKEIRKFGEPKNFSFTPKAHFEIGEGGQLMDFERAAKLSGARFVVLKGEIARLERALAQFMLDVHTKEFGYQEISPPYMVKDSAMFGAGNLPKFAADSFSLDMNTASAPNTETLEGQIFARLKRDLQDKNPELLNYISGGKDEAEAFAKLLQAAERSMASQSADNRRWLIPTAEVPLTNLVADEILKEEELPLRFTAFTPCFRSEAGSAGRDTRGMLRQHQFSKVELVSIAHPDKSAEEHERMTSAAETILKRLELPYRVMLLCSGDMGFASQKTYDLEVWLPAQNTYREISSCSNCGEFQARRMKARFKGRQDKSTRFVHTLNGSALAVGRTLIAVLENYQEADGSVTIPLVLRPYMDGKQKILAA